MFLSTLFRSHAIVENSARSAGGGRLTELSFKEIKKADIPKLRVTSNSNYEKLIKSFLESTAEAYEVTVPEGRKAWNFYSSLHRYIKLSGLENKVKVKVVENKRVFLVRP